MYGKDQISYEENGLWKTHAVEDYYVMLNQDQRKALQSLLSYTHVPVEYCRIAHADRSIITQGSFLSKKHGLKFMLDLNGLHVLYSGKINDKVTLHEFH